MIGVEPDTRMAEVARRSGVEVDVGVFEEWDPAGQAFDLVVAAQAWHRLDPEVAPHRAADVLGPGGVLAPFWNLSTHDEATKEALDRVHAELGPTGGAGPLAGGSDWSPESRIGAIDASGRFGPVETFDIDWTREYSRAEWLDQLPSHSVHRLMEPDDLARLLDAIAEVIDDADGSFTMSYRCVALVAPRR